MSGPSSNRSPSYTTPRDVIGRAERAFSSIRPDDRSERFGGFDEVMFASHAGTCWVDLGQTELATEHIASALNQMAGQARRRVYGTIQLAKIAVIEKDLEKASALGLEALEAASGLASHRSIHHLTDLGKLLGQHGTTVTNGYTERLKGLTPAQR